MVKSEAPVPKRDPKQQAARAVEKITRSGKVRGEDPTSSSDLFNAAR